MDQRRSALNPALLLWVLPAAFLGFFFFYPLASIFHLAFQSALDSGVNLHAFDRIIRPLGFTFWQAGLSTLLTLLLGIPAAFLFGRFDFRGKKVLRTLSTLPFILPTVVAAAGFNALIGPRGLLNAAWMSIFQLTMPPIQILNTLGAILLAHVFYNTTIVIRMVGGAWEQLDVRQEQAARVLGASPLRVFREVTLPLLFPHILASALLVFLFDFTSFGVILMLGGPQFATIETEIYVQAMHMLNLPAAGLLSAVQLGCTFGMTALSAWLNRRRAAVLAPRIHGEGMRRPRTWQEKCFVVLLSITLLVLLVSPLLALTVRSFTRFQADRGERGSVQMGLTFDYYRELFVNQRGSIFYVPPIDAVKNSLLYASGTVILSLGMGFLASAALARRSRINRWLDAILMLPLGASAVTLGLGFLVVFSRPPFQVSHFPWLIPFAHSLVALPFVVRTLQPVIASIPPGLRQAASVLGASPIRVWWHIDFPILARAAVISAVFSFTISLGEFGATTFLSRPEYPTIPIAIYRFLTQPGGMNYGQALAMSTILLVICALGIGLMDRLRLPGSGEL